MNNKWFCSPVRPPRATEIITKSIFSQVCIAALVVMAVSAPPSALAGDAPAWMHAVVDAPLPPHDEKTDAVLLYSEKVVTVQSADKIKTLTRAAYRILRPGGSEMGNVVIPFDAQTKISNLRAWCIPAHGKDFEVKEKDGADVSIPGRS